jgi:hypothetical protein
VDFTKSCDEGLRFGRPLGAPEAAFGQQRAIAEINPDAIPSATTEPLSHRKTQERSKELGNNSNAIGKSRTQWGTLHQTVAFRDLMSKAS